MRFEIIYDYEDEWAGTCYNLCEHFDGSWPEMEEYVKQMREAGCYAINVSCVDDGDAEDDEPFEEEYEDPWEREFIRSVAGGDYSSANPWDAPGMSASDFI